MTYGSATPITAQSLLPSTGLKDVIFWSTIAFAFGGVESASTMGEEIVDARRTVPRAVVTAAVIITTLYIVATLCVLLALPKEQVSGLAGPHAGDSGDGRQGGRPVARADRRRARSRSTHSAASAAGLRPPPGCRSWPASIASCRARSADLHPRWGTPYVALLVQAAIAAVFVFLGQAGTSVRGAYEVLVSMSIIAYFIPFLFMFAAMIKLQREPAGPEVIRVPGGRRGRPRLGVMGFAVSAAAIVLACVPADDEPNKTLAVVKIVGASVALVAIGAIIYFMGKRRS